MLSRVSSHSIQKPISCLLARTASQKKTPALACRLPVFAKLAEKPLAFAAAPSAGNNLYIRPVRPELPGSVRLGFIPEEWFTFFYKTTGVTGPYTFAFTLFTYLASKEIYVMDHEYYFAISSGILCIFVVKKLGPGFKQALDDEIDQIEAKWNQSRNDQIKMHEADIEAEKKGQWCNEGQLLLNDAKKEDVRLQLEAAYRERLALVYEEVKRRLEFQVECQHVERRIKQKHLVNWVHSKVIGSITPEQDKKTFQQCIAHLDSLGSGDNSAWNGCKVC